MNTFVPVVLSVFHFVSLGYVPKDMNLFKIVRNFAIMLSRMFVLVLPVGKERGGCRNCLAALLRSCAWYPVVCPGADFRQNCGSQQSCPFLLRNACILLLANF
jgi:hypothetical protein